MTGCGRARVYVAHSRQPDADEPRRIVPVAAQVDVLPRPAAQDELAAARTD